MKSLKQLIEKVNTYERDNPHGLNSIMSELSTDFVPGKLPKSGIRVLVHSLVKRSTTYEGVRRLMEFVLTGDGTILRSLGFFLTPTSGRGFGDDLKNTQGSVDLDIWGPFKRIPDIRSFYVELKSFDPLFALFGIKKRFAPNYHFQKYVNRSLNRYVEHQLIRLSKAQKGKNQVLFGRIATGSIRRSLCFFLVQLQDTCLNGHRNYSLYTVKLWFRKYSKIASKLSSDVRYKRVFIPKGVSKLRPLGVPDYEWRIYLGLTNKFTQIFLKPIIHKDQHAYIHGKGVLTAGDSIVRNEVLKSRDIGEFDLRSFFPSVDLRSISDELQFHKVPTFIRDLFYNICSRLPYNLVGEWDKELKYVESLPVEKQERLALELKHWGFSDIQSALKSNSSFWRKILLSLNPSSNFEVEVDLDKTLEVYRDGRYITTKVKGVPQGIPVAPLLSLLVLNVAMFQQGMKCIMYADDGFFYGDIEDSTGLGRSLPFGVSYAEDKCGGVKKNFIGNKPFKFLGFEYDGIKQTFYANTRNGSKLVYDRSEMVRLIKERELIKDKQFKAVRVLEINSMEGVCKKLGCETLNFGANNIAYYTKDTKTEKVTYEVHRSLKRGEGFYVVLAYYDDTDSGRAQRNKLHWRSGENLVKSSCYGLIMNRMQSGNGNLEGFEQDFRLKYIRGSGMDRHEKGIIPKGLNVFNSTSFALKSLSYILKREQINMKKLKLLGKLQHVKDIKQPIRSDSPYLKLRLDAPQFYTERYSEW